MTRHLPSPDHHASSDDAPRIVVACAALAESTPFNLAIFGVILANAVVLGLETYDEIAHDWGDLLRTLNDAFLAVFVVELAIRITGYGTRPREFFRNGWNVFDLLVVTASFAPGLRENATLLRLIRLARVLRIVRLLPDLRVLVTAIGRSLPGVASLVVLAVLTLFIYGMVGWVIFDDHAPAEYGTIGRAMLTLFVTLTLENLPEQIELGRSLSDWTIFYFIGYTLIAAFLLFNILIGVVINSLEEAREIERARERAERLEDSEPGREVALVERVSDLRRALDDLERELRRDRP